MRFQTMALATAAALFAGGISDANAQRGPWNDRGARPGQERLEVVARERMPLDRDALTVRVGERAGRLDALQLTFDGRRILVRNVIVRFRRGREQVFRIGQEMRRGDRTPLLKLESRRGAGRFVETVTVETEARRGRRDVEITVLANKVRDDRDRPRYSDDRGRRDDRYDRDRDRRDDRYDRNRDRRDPPRRVETRPPVTPPPAVTPRRRDDDRRREETTRRPAPTPTPTPPPRAAGNPFGPGWFVIGTVNPPRSGFGDGRVDIPPSIGIVKQLGVLVQRHDVRFLGFNINHTDGDQSQLPIQGTFRAGTSSRPETLAKQVPIQNLTFRFHTVGPGGGLAEVQIWARR